MVTSVKVDRPEVRKVKDLATPAVVEEIWASAAASRQAEAAAVQRRGLRSRKHRNAK